MFAYSFSIRRGKDRFNRTVIAYDFEEAKVKLEKFKKKGLDFSAFNFLTTSLKPANIETVHNYQSTFNRGLYAYVGGNICILFDNEQIVSPCVTKKNGKYQVGPYCYIIHED